MKKLFYISLIIFGISFCSAQTGKIDGKLILENKDDFELIAGKTKIILELNGEKQTTIVDKDLNFSFNNLNSGKIRISTEPKAIGNVVRYTSEIENGEIIKIEIPYALTCKYDKSIDNKVCPICKKVDRVIPIVYGLIIDTGKNKKKYHVGGCLVSECDPNWYCERDKIEF